MKRLTRAFFSRDTVRVAQELLGKILVHDFAGERLMGIISETEAYGTPDDAASHAAHGYTERTRALFGVPGHAYLYLSYGVHECFNTVAHAPEAEAGGVLIRAVHPTAGVELMRRHRGAASLAQLANGPGKLTQAFALSRAQHYGIDLTAPESLVYVLDAQKQVRYKATPRIGISKNTQVLWRFVMN